MAKGAVVLGVLALGCLAAQAQTLEGDTKELASFAVTNVGKFAVELEQAPRVLELRYRVKFERVASWQYDAEKQKLSTRWPMRLSSGEPVSMECATRTYKAVGERTMAVRTVTASDCLSVEFEDTHDGLVADIELPMTPDAYRRAKTHGFVLRVGFEPAKGEKAEIVTKAEFHNAPTVGRPYDTRLTHYRVRGLVRSLSIHPPEGGAALATAERSMPPS